MKKKSITIIITVLVLLIGGAIAYVALRPQTQPTVNVPVAQNPKPAEEQPAPTQQTQTSGKYANYDAAAIASTAGRKLLFFHAAWCPQCRNLEKTIVEGKIPSGMTIFKVNYDTATDLRQKYGVTQQTTIVEVDDQGKELKKFVAYNEPTLAAVLKAFGG